jgi:hypothetical protein
LTNTHGDVGSSNRAADTSASNTAEDVDEENPWIFRSPDLLPAVDVSLGEAEENPESDEPSFGLPEVLWEGHDCFGKYTPFEVLNFTNTKIEHDLEFEVPCSAEECKDFCMTWYKLPACFDLIDLVISSALPPMLQCRHPVVV